MEVSALALGALTLQGAGCGLLIATSSFAQSSRSGAWLSQDTKPCLRCTPNCIRTLSTTKWLVRIGQQESNFFDELDAKRHNQEPLSDFEQKILRKLRLRWLRWRRRKV
jgi:hypothetical protein